ncbi:YesL family protein [Amphibacillus sediminis]|uniref:YesL family protein n=1 Tax=Amphibacillus sediminis TaxID=360185 RepID=UPI00082B1076|nr:DUF624 domain-containing protein [Amphibacillus sediminis]
MEFKGIWDRLNQIALIVSRFAYLNLLWLIFSLVGLVVFGLMPATVSMFSITRRWLLKDNDVPIFTTFLQTYKKEFLKTNGLMLILLSGATLLYINLRYAGFIRDTTIYPFFLGITFIALFLYLVLTLYLAPVYVHYHLTVKRYIAYPILFGLTNLHHTIAMLVSLSAVYYLSMQFPGIVLFFSFSVSAFIINYFANFSFSRIQMMEQKLDQSA